MIYEKTVKCVSQLINVKIEEQMFDMINNIIQEELKACKEGRIKDLGQLPLRVSIKIEEDKEFDPHMSIYCNKCGSFDIDVEKAKEENQIKLFCKTCGDFNMIAGVIDETKEK